MRDPVWWHHGVCFTDLPVIETRTGSVTSLTRPWQAQTNTDSWCPKAAVHSLKGKKGAHFVRLGGNKLQAERQCCWMHRFKLLLVLHSAIWWLELLPQEWKYKPRFSLSWRELAPIIILGENPKLTWLDRIIWMVSNQKCNFPHLVGRHYPGMEHSCVWTPEVPKSVDFGPHRQRQFCAKASWSLPPGWDKVLLGRLNRRGFLPSRTLVWSTPGTSRGPTVPTLSWKEEDCSW